jgi:hypothetical protein
MGIESATILIRRIDLNHADRYAKLLKHFIALPGANLRTIAELAAAAACLELNIDHPPAIRAMDQSEIRADPHKLGYAPMRKENLIVIRMDQCPCAIARIAAHETRHRQQIDSGRFLDMLGQGTTESDAQEFEARFAQKYFPSNGCRCKQRR